MRLVFFVLFCFNLFIMFKVLCTVLLHSVVAVVNTVVLQLEGREFDSRPGDFLCGVYVGFPQVFLGSFWVL